MISLGSFAPAQTADSEAKSLFNEARALASQPEAAKQRQALEKFQTAARRFHEDGVTYNGGSRSAQAPSSLS
jgi:hypothetical protein